MDSTLRDLTSSFDQLVSQANLTNTHIARFDSFPNVFEFLEHYEDATALMSDDRKIRLLNRAFPQGCNRAWFEMEIIPLIGGPTTWSQVKTKIVDRFADADYKDRHFHRLRELHYDPQGKEGLLDFVEHMFYCYKKAYAITSVNSNALRFVKASIPQDVRAILNREVSFREADSEETFKAAIKRYDNYKQAMKADTSVDIHIALKSILRRGRQPSNRYEESGSARSLMD